MEATFTTTRSRRDVSAVLAIPQAANHALIVGLALAHFYILFLLPLYFLPLSPWWGLMILPFCLLHSLQWGLIHEAIHKQLHADREVNEVGGRLLSILLGVSFHVLRFGHVMHHQLNRDWQSEMVAHKSVAATAHYWFTLLGGIYFTEVLSGLMMAFLPKDWFLAYARRRSITGQPEIHAAGARFFYERGNIAPVRVDVAVIVALYGAAFVLYAAASWMLIAFLMTRALMVSFMDNIYHYGTMRDDLGKDLHLVPWAALLFLNGNYHGTHHRNSDVPWLYLPRVHAAQQRPFTGGFIAHGLQQFRGPIVATNAD